MILKKEKIIFIHVPRTSGTSIEQFLLKNRPVPDGIKHLRASQLHKMIGPAAWNEYFKFSVIRNPWDKVISHYHQPYYGSINSLSGNNLKSFLQKYKPAPWEHGWQCSDFIDKDLDLIIRFEDRDAGLKKLESQAGVYVDKNVHHKATSQRRTREYKDYYDDETREIVAHRYKDDIERFGYTF